MTRQALQACAFSSPFSGMMSVNAMFQQGLNDSLRQRGASIGSEEQPGWRKCNTAAIHFTTYLPRAVRLWAKEGAMAIAFSVVVAESEMGPVYRWDLRVGLDPSVVK